MNSFVKDNGNPILSLHQEMHECWSQATVAHCCNGAALSFTPAQTPDRADHSQRSKSSVPSTVQATAASCTSSLPLHVTEPIQSPPVDGTSPPAHETPADTHHIPFFAVLVDESFAVSSPAHLDEGRSVSPWLARGISAPPQGCPEWGVSIGHGLTGSRPEKHLHSPTSISRKVQICTVARGWVH